MATYGELPGVRIETSSVGISNVTVGRESILTFIGVGGDDALATPNEPVRLDSRSTVREQFGEDSDVMVAYEQATANGADNRFMYGILVETSQEEITFDSQSGTIETDIVPDTSTMTYSEDSTDGTVRFSYGDTVSAPDASGVLSLNPITGSYQTNSGSASMDLSYEKPLWEDAVRAARNTLDEGQFGTIAPLTYEQSAISTLQTTLTKMREDELKMAVGVYAAEPNTTVRDQHPGYDTESLSTRFQDDAMFSVVGASLASRSPNQSGFGTSALGAVAGLFAGTANDEPIYDNTVLGVNELAQEFTRADVAALRGENFIPLRETDGIRIRDNQSTYNQESGGGWERDLFHRQIVDIAILTTYRIARRQIGGVLDSDTVDDVQDAVTVELAELVDDGLLQAGGQEVNTFRASSQEIGVEVDVTPLGVAKSATIELNILQ